MSSPHPGSRRRLLLALVLAVVVIVAVPAGIVWWWLDRPLPLAERSAELSIEPGTPPRQVAADWVQAGVQTHPEFLYQWFRWSGRARLIRAGSYEIDAGTTPRQLLEKMVQGDELRYKLLIGEGWTWRQLKRSLATAPHLKHADLDDDAALMAAIGAPGEAVEGAFFPDTYVYSRGVSDLTVLKRAHAALQRRLDAAWAQRTPGLPLTSPQQALILASIVEKETGPKDDPGLVAAVFLNRLRLGMPLQTDPSVIYGLGEAFDGNLRKQHLLTDHPFNTYTRPGLPPTPIAMPSQASLMAVVHPTPSRALYFVARGDGSSVFSDTLADHNRAVQKYQKARRP